MTPLDVNIEWALAWLGVVFYMGLGHKLLLSHQWWRSALTRHISGAHQSELDAGPNSALWVGWRRLTQARLSDLAIKDCASDVYGVVKMCFWPQSGKSDFSCCCLKRAFSKKNRLSNAQIKAFPQTYYSWNFDLKPLPKPESSTQKIVSDTNRIVFVTNRLYPIQTYFTQNSSIQTDFIRYKSFISDTAYFTHYKPILSGIPLFNPIMFEYSDNMLF